LDSPVWSLKLNLSLHCLVGSCPFLLPPYGLSAALSSFPLLFRILSITDLSSFRALANSFHSHRVHARHCGSGGCQKVSNFSIFFFFRRCSFVFGELYTLLFPSFILGSNFLFVFYIGVKSRIPTPPTTPPLNRRVFLRMMCTQSVCRFFVIPRIPNSNLLSPPFLSQSPVVRTFFPPG